MSQSSSSPSTAVSVELEVATWSEQPAASSMSTGEPRAADAPLNRRLQAILEGMAEGVTVQDVTGAVIFANTAAARVSGYGSVSDFMRATPAEIVAKFEIYDELGEPFDGNAFPGRRVLRGEPSASATMRVVERDSRREWWTVVRATPMLDNTGAVELAINVWHDITAQRRREEHERYLANASATLSASLDYASRLRALAGLLVPGLADWCAVHLLEGEDLRPVVVSHANPERLASAERYNAKFPPSREAKQGLWQVVRTGVGELYEDISDELLQRGAQSEEHLQLLRSAGMRSLLIAPIRVRDQVSGTLSLVAAESGRRYDVRDLRLAEELGRRAGTALENARLYESERKARAQLELVARAGETFSTTLDYERTLRNVVDICLPVLGDFAFFDVVEGDGVRRIAAAFEDAEVEQLLMATRWIRSERQDKNLCALSSGNSGLHSAIDDDWRRDVATTPEHLALLRRLELGSLVTVPLRADGVLVGALTVCFGKSRRRHTEEDLRTVEELARRGAVAVLQSRLFLESRAAVIAAEEASTIKDEFLATVSHELRTPLNAIVGWSSLLRERVTDPAQSKGLDVIYRNAQAQAKIIDDILDVSRIITGKLKLELEPLDLVSVVQDSVDVVRPSANAKRIEIDFSKPVEPCLLVADRQRVQQVAWNLLSNAVKFSEREGKIAITLEPRDNEFCLRVSDRGSGIDEEFLPYVFERFKQADASTTRRVGGLGLGLAIVRHIVELHGGRVLAESEGPGSGASFTVWLPSQPSVPALIQDGARYSQRPPPHVEESLVTLNGLRVLVVDDELDARDLLQAVLETAGAVVRIAASAREAFEIFQSFIPDVLVSDIGMPDEDGYALMRKIRALGFNEGGAVPALALTAYTRGQDRTKALSVGFTGHLGKPVRPAELVAAVTTLSKLAVNRRTP